MLSVLEQHENWPKASTKMPLWIPKVSASSQVKRESYTFLLSDFSHFFSLFGRKMDYFEWLIMFLCSDKRQTWEKCSPSIVL